MKEKPKIGPKKGNAIDDKSKKKLNRSKKKPDRPYSDSPNHESIAKPTETMADQTEDAKKN